MGGKTSAASHNKYIAKAYDRVNLILRKDGPQNKTAVQSAADSAGESLNAYIVGAVAQRMERDASSAPESPAEALPPDVENMLEQGSRRATETQGGVQCD